MAENTELNNDQKAAVSEPSQNQASLEKQTKDFTNKQLEPFRNQANPLLHVLHEAEIFNATIVSGAANEAPLKKALEKSLSSEHKLIKKTSIEIKFNKKDSDGNLFFDGLMIHASRVDAHGDIFSDINKIRDRYTESDGLNRVDIDHKLEFNKANIVEFYIVPKGHPLWKDKFVGSLAAKFKVTDIETKERVMNGDLDGISIFVSARLQDVATKKDKAKFYINKAFNLLKTENNIEKGELSMNQFEIIQKSLEDFISKFTDEMKEMKDEMSKISGDLEKTDEKVEKTDEKVEETVEKTEKVEEKNEKLSDFEKSVTASVKELSEKVTKDLNDIKDSIKNLQLNKDSGDDSGQHEESAGIKPQYIKLEDN